MSIDIAYNIKKYRNKISQIIVKTLYQAPNKLLKMSII